MTIVPDMSLILDVVVAALLMATIVYCIILYRQLARVRNAQEEMRGLIASFDDATNRAQAGITALKRTNDEIIDALRKEMDKGRLLADELAILNESGDRLANRIEGGLKDRPANDTRSRQFDSGSSPADHGAERARDTGLKSEAERELLEALRASR
jgi:hypothetical protein